MKNEIIKEVVHRKTNSGFVIKKRKNYGKKSFEENSFHSINDLIRFIFCSSGFHAYGNFEARAFLAEQGFTDIKIGVYLAKDRCYSSQYFRYRFEAIYPNSSEKVAGEVCGGGNVEEWFSGCSPLGHFAQVHRERKDAVIKGVWVAIFTQLAVFFLLILARKE